MLISPKVVNKCAFVLYTFLVPFVLYRVEVETGCIDARRGG